MSPTEAETQDSIFYEDAMKTTGRKQKVKDIINKLFRRHLAPF